MSRGNSQTELMNHHHHPSSYSPIGHPSPGMGSQGSPYPHALGLGAMLESLEGLDDYDLDGMKGGAFPRVSRQVRLFSGPLCL